VAVYDVGEGYIASGWWMASHSRAVGLRKTIEVAVQIARTSTARMVTARAPA